MGQATVDLPDPLENPKSAQLSSADDLLAQLAGDEIDRLLADADGEHAPTPAASAAPKDAAVVVAPTSVRPAGAAASDALDGEIDELFDALKATDPVPSVTPATAAVESVSAASPVAEKPSAVATMPVADAPAAAVEKVEVQRAVTAPNDELERELAAADAERAALVRAKPAQATQVDLLSDVGDEKELPAMFKPLVWLSAPLDAFPDEVREMLGKIAILTMVNAVAVLAYVMLFRRHH